MAKFIYKNTQQIVETDDKEKIKSMKANSKYTEYKDEKEVFIEKNYGEEFKKIYKDIAELKSELAELKEPKK